MTRTTNLERRRLKQLQALLTSVKTLGDLNILPRPAAARIAYILTGVIAEAVGEQNPPGLQSCNPPE